MTTEATLIEETVTVKTSEVPQAAAPALTRHAISWFELPTLDLNRAARFYSTILGTPLHRGFYGEEMAVFAAGEGGVSGALVQRAEQRPGSRGALLYLNCDGMLDEATARVEAAGGTVVVPVTVIGGGYGRFSSIRDSEGNLINLHSR